MEKKPKIQKKSDELKARLIKLGCFDEFCENLKEQHYKVDFKEFVNDGKRINYDDKAFLESAFVWICTPQGFIFWNDISDKINEI